MLATTTTTTCTLEGATVRRPGRAVLVAASVMLLPFVGFAFVAAGASQTIRSLVAIVAVGEAFALLAVAMIFPRVIWGAGKTEATRVDVDARGLFLDGALAMRRHDIASVAVSTALDGHGRAHVVVAGQRRLSTIVLDVRDAEAARRLAIALDADASLTSYLVETDPLLPGSIWRRALLRALFVVPLFSIVLFVMATRLHAIVPVGYVPLAIGFFFALFRRTAPTRAIFGADGIALRRRGAPVRFVPLSTIRSVAASSRGADVVLATGDRISLVVVGVDPSTDAQAASLARALESAQLVAVARDEVVERRLDRSARSTRDWLGELRAMRPTAAQGYRDLSLDENRLLALVESPLAPSSARAAAAVLVAPLLDQEGRVRMQAAASRTATPGLRDVMEATLREADESELESLLELECAINPGRAR